LAATWSWNNTWIPQVWQVVCQIWQKCLVITENYKVNEEVCCPGDLNALALVDIIFVVSV
jgi:hypothetical protein